MIFNCKSIQKQNNLTMVLAIFVISISLQFSLYYGSEESLSYSLSGADWNEACASGSNQSPIDIPLSYSSKSANVGRLKKSDTIEILVSQNNMQGVAFKDLYFHNGAISFWNYEAEPETFQLLQFHVHSPSEHTFDGKHYDLEIHFVHKHFSDNKLAVLSVQFDVEDGGDRDNEFITALKLDSKNMTALTIPTMNLINRLKKNNLYYYKGSLTTPPCSEIVNWLVVHDPQPISKTQINYFNAKWLNNQTYAHGHGNNRAVQPLNERFVYMKVDSSMMGQASLQYQTGGGSIDYSSGGSNWKDGFCSNSDVLDMIMNEGLIAGVKLNDLGTTYQIDFTNGILAMWTPDGVMSTYNLLQFHVHAPSEHTFDGKHYDLEIHFVHNQPGSSQLAVVSVSFDVEDGGNESNDFIDALHVDYKNQSALTIPTMKLLGKLNYHNLYHYQGSLTTPPCSEVVNWLVVNDPQPISAIQLRNFNDKWMSNTTFAHGHGNNRVTQPINSRYVYLKANADSLLASSGISSLMQGLQKTLVGVFSLHFFYSIQTIFN